MKQEAKNKRRFNFVDAVILLLILAAVALAAFIFVFKGPSFFTNLIGGQQKEIYYAVELSRVREELVGNVQPGDKVRDGVRNYDIGTVVGTLSGDCEHIGAAPDGTAVAGGYPGYQSLIVIISARAANTGYEYSIGGYDLQPGAEVSFKTPGLSGTGFCVGLEVVENDQAKEAFWESTASKVYYAEVKAEEE